MNRKEVIESRLTNHKKNIDALWVRTEYFKSEIDGEHNRISVLAPKVDAMYSDFREQQIMVDGILRVLKQSGILEQAVSGDNLFQFRPTVDRLQRNPLYKINKVVTK